IPENRPFVDLARQCARRYRVCAALDRRDHQQLQDAVAQCELRLIIALDRDVTPAPFFPPPGAVAGETAVVAKRTRPPDGLDGRLCDRPSDGVVIRENREVLVEGVVFPRHGAEADDAQVPPAPGFVGYVAKTYVGGLGDDDPL